MSAIVRLEPGTIFASDFRVVAPLSAGGMGTVYVVDQISTGARRALKLMHPQMVADETLRRRFEQEARISARIESDHVIHVVGAGVDAATATPWMAMELLAGIDLSAHVEATGPVTPATLLLIFEQLCHALSAAHRMGVVHRDLKPENIYLSKPRSSGAAFTLKVLDFGIAKIAAETTASHTAAVGTPMWMAPEQTSPGQHVSPQTDIWPLGLIAFWLLTGRSFWRASSEDKPTMAMFLREILIDDIPPASARSASFGCGVALSLGFDRWFARCLQRDPKARYATVSEAHEELARVFSQEQSAPATTGGSAAWAHSIADLSSRASPSTKQMVMTAAPVTSPPSAPASRGLSSVRRRSLLIGVGAPALIATGALGLFLALRSAPKANPQKPSQAGSAVAAAAETTATPLAPPPSDTVTLAPQTVGGGAHPDPSAAPSSPTAGPTSIPEANPGGPAESTSSRAPGRARDVTTSPRGAGPEPRGDPQRAFAEINKVVRSNLSAIKRQCWAPAIAARQPDSPSNAKVIVSLTISPEGTVQSAEARGGDEFPGLAGCVQSQAAKLRFPASSDGSVVSVPFVFAAQ